MASFCGYCGTELDSVARFCPACGKPASDQPATTPTTTRQGTHDHQAQKESRRDRPRLTLVIVVAIVGVAAVAAAVLLLTGVWPTESPQAQSSTTASIPGSTPVSAGLPVADVERLGLALSSGNPSQIASVIDVPEGVDVGDLAAEMLPDGTNVTVDGPSFVDFGQGFGAVEAMLSGGVDGRAILYLRFVDGMWLVSGTSAPEVVEE